MKYREYIIHPEFCNSNSILWKVTGNGEFILGDKGGETYFIKRNIHNRYPSRDLPKAVYIQYLEAAKVLETKQKKLKSLMKDLKWDRDYILVEEKNFWDYDGLFTTVTHYVEDSLGNTYDYSDLTLEEFVQLALSVAKLIKILHNCGVIHGDIKEKNFIIQKKDGTYIPYLVDFDSSYPMDDIPTFENIGGTEGYQSPEVLAYSVLEDKSLKATITSKVDVFSLAVAFHRWWTNAFPGSDLEDGSVGAAVYYEKEVIINEKFNDIIGPNKKATLKSLLNWMLAKDIKERASIDDVIEVLEDKQSVAVKYIIGDDFNPFDEKLWLTHEGYADLLSIDELQKKNIDSFKRYNTGTGCIGLKYFVRIGEEELILSIDEVINKGYAKRKPILIDEPWEEHRMEFENSDVILSKGYREIKRIFQMGIRRYLLTDINGRKIDRGYEWFIKQGLAHLKKYEINVDTPWPEHGTRYIQENLNKLGVKSISRIEVGGEHRYKIVFNDTEDGKNKIQENVSVNNIKLMGFLE